MPPPFTASLDFLWLYFLSHLTWRKTSGNGAATGLEEGVNLVELTVTPPTWEGGFPWWFPCNL